VISQAPMRNAVLRSIGTQAQRSERWFVLSATKRYSTWVKLKSVKQFTSLPYGSLSRPTVLTPGRPKSPSARRRGGLSHRASAARYRRRQEQSECRRHPAVDVDECKRAPKAMSRPGGEARTRCGRQNRFYLPEDYRRPDAAGLRSRCDPSDPQTGGTCPRRSRIAFPDPASIRLTACLRHRGALF
jgi:hypothetical protein